MSSSSFSLCDELLKKVQEERTKRVNGELRVQNLLSKVKNQKREAIKKRKISFINDQIIEVQQKLLACKRKIIDSREELNKNNNNYENKLSLSLMSGETLLLHDTLSNKIMEIRQEKRRCSLLVDKHDKQVSKELQLELLRKVQQKIEQELSKTRLQLAEYQQEKRVSYSELVDFKHNQKKNSDDDDDDSNGVNCMYVNSMIEERKEAAKEQLATLTHSNNEVHNNIFQSFVITIDNFAEELRERFDRFMQSNKDRWKFSSKCEYEHKKQYFNNTCDKRACYCKYEVERAIDIHSHIKMKANTINAKSNVLGLTHSHNLFSAAEIVQCILPWLKNEEIHILINIVEEERRERRIFQMYLLDFDKQIQILLTEYEVVLDLANEQEQEKSAKLIGLQEQKERQRRMHEKLNEQRQTFKIKKEEEKHKLEEQERKREQKRLKMRAREHQEFQLRLKVLQEYLEAKELMRKELEELAKLNNEETKLKRMEQSKRNAMCVAKRELEYKLKLQRRNELEHKIEQEHAKKQRALESFFRHVDTQLNIHADWTRVIQETEASKCAANHSASLQSPFSKTAHEFPSTLRTNKATPLYGYSDETVMRDPRVRLYCALLKENLHKTEYGREVVNRLYHIPAAQTLSRDNPFHVEEKQNYIYKKILIAHNNEQLKLTFL